MKECPWRVKISYLLTAGFIGLVAAPFLLLVFYNLRSFDYQANERLLQDGNYILHSTERSISEKLDSVETIVSALAYNSNLSSFLARSYSGAASFEEYSQTVLPILQSAADSASPPIQRLWVLSQNRTLPNGSTLLKHASTAQLEALEEFLDGRPNGGWHYSPENLIPNSLESYLRQDFYFVHAIASPYGRQVGYVVAKVLSSTLFGEFLLSQDSQRAFFLLDGENRPCMSNVALEEGLVFPTGPEVSRSPQVLYLSTQASRLPLGLGLAFSSPDRQVLLDKSFTAILAVLVVSVLFLFGFYYILHIIAVRLRAYARDMERIAASGFKGRLNVSHLYELGEIGVQFNDTLTEIHSLMREKIRQETAYKDIQLQALMSQINPHFIYNTLDMFSAKLALNGEYEISDYMSDFAGMLRYNTTTPGMFLPLGDEVEYTKSYVNLQRCRYGSAIALRIHIPPALLGVQVLRLLLQPVVENAFVHGFVQLPPNARREVVITARASRGLLLLRVRDNGQGIPPEQVRQMNETFAQPSPVLKKDKRKGSIGLENINQRLQLFYAGQGRIFLRSIPGGHTSVFLVFKNQGGDVG
ncbi:histidine kinase [Acutalibacter sp.]|jgi:two-component system sensor histidine kinase YesM|uniref:sensor histidine kinase n=1 Tax=Acutalibacter sp. TaxID=1918636 RepID=UPI00216C0A71|nr:histidine kinase [Acutalibacter sp.]